MDRLTAKQKEPRGQDWERKGGRSDAYTHNRHALQGGLSQEQQNQHYADTRLPSDPRPEVTQPDPELEGTGAYAGQVRRQAADQARTKQWDDARPATGSAAKYTQEEREQIMKQANRVEAQNRADHGEHTTWLG